MKQGVKTQAPAAGSIFLQSIWRSTSTYWWTKAREIPSLRAYNEPLHENLLRLTRADFEKIHETLGPSLRHPETDRESFAEYPLRPEGGMEGFQERFSLRDFHLSPRRKDDELQSYLQTLVDTAEAGGQRAFLKFTRGFLRAEWMAAHFPGTHLYLNRSAAGLMQSFMSFHGVHSYYFRQIAAIVHENRASPLFGAFAEWSGLDKDGAAYKKLDHDASVQLRADMVFLFWSLGLAEASRYADLVIDSDNLATGTSVQELAARMADLTGVEWKLGDYAYKAPHKPLLAVSDGALEIIRDAVAHLKPRGNALTAAGLAPSTRRGLDLVLR